MKDRFELINLRSGKASFHASMCDALETAERRALHSYRVTESFKGERLLRLQIGSSTT